MMEQEKRPYVGYEYKKITVAEKMPPGIWTAMNLLAGSRMTMRRRFPAGIWLRFL